MRTGSDPRVSEQAWRPSHAYDARVWPPRRRARPRRVRAPAGIYRPGSTRGTWSASCACVAQHRRAISKEKSRTRRRPFWIRARFRGELKKNIIIESLSITQALRREVGTAANSKRSASLVSIVSFKTVTWKAMKGRPFQIRVAPRLWASRGRHLGWTPRHAVAASCPRQKLLCRQHMYHWQQGVPLSDRAACAEISDSTSARELAGLMCLTQEVKGQARRARRVFCAYVVAKRCPPMFS